MDLEYLRAHPDKLPMFIEHQRIRSTPVGGGSISVTQRLTLDDGTDVFAKFNEDGPPGLLEAETRGIAWLAEAGAPVPHVLCATAEVLVSDWIDPGAPGVVAAEELGRRLAELHRFGTKTFGAPWPGFIGRLPLDNEVAERSWSGWFASRRLLPYLRDSRDNGSLSAADVAAVEAVITRIEELAPPAEPVARLHGDLWPGNIHWGRDRAWLVDPAAHGGHRETDIALLHLWGGAPHLDRIVAAYHEMWPLPEGWRHRIPLHQLHLLLVHTAMFGSGYRDQVMDAVRQL
ncbi:fructosamine kinase family protein [Stackebrandtia nassauensis]|uniref:fructosamine kinase family protein n=1 Tax=Stackebrandtia nassauensis TaxID=283811 RepID=UPI0001A39880|nr:fructosamine kinase family protein [Stackebrandtia nassauensis]